jgi:hypothetical protein
VERGIQWISGFRENTKKIDPVDMGLRILGRAGSKNGGRLWGRESAKMLPRKMRRGKSVSMNVMARESGEGR